MGWDGSQIGRDDVENFVRERLASEIVDSPNNVLALNEVEGGEAWAVAYRSGSDIKGAIVLVRWDDDWCNVKILTEDEGPVATAMPVAILDMLTPTDSEDAQEWRDDCRKIASGAIAVIRPGMTR